MNIKEILKISGDFLSLKNLENPRFDCELLLSEYLECSRTELYLNADREISDLDKDNTRVLLDRRANYEPLQYIIGNVDFYGNKIFVDRNVLIPRPETEFLVDLILKENRHFNSILELGTGSGAIAVALKKELQNVRLDAVDISENILKIARQNAIFNNAEINFFVSDLFEKVTKKYDLIVSNPPYISEKEYMKLPLEIREYEPKEALIAGENGLLFYKQILQNAKEHLTEDGKIYFEIGEKQAGKIKKIAEEGNFEKIEICKDLNNKNRYMIING